MKGEGSKTKKNTTLYFLAFFLFIIWLSVIMKFFSIRITHILPK